MNSDACNTLKTRTAFHFLNKIGKQKLYYDYLYGKITRDQLWDSVPKNLIESVINTEISKQNLELPGERGAHWPTWGRVMYNWHSMQD